MCYNCGCKMPNDDHGKKENITNSTFRQAASAMDMGYEDSVKNVLELIRTELDEHNGGRGEIHGHGLDHDHDHDHS